VNAEQSLNHAYEVVGEMLEYFDSHKLATHAPLVALILRERALAYEQGFRACSAIWQEATSSYNATSRQSSCGTAQALEDGLRMEPGHE
jgi:predicted glycoside hydrolase/deacetylase ChbG (UPF0249 family)